MSAWWNGTRRKHKVAIVVAASVLALAMLLWLDASGAGDPRLCGHWLSG